MWGSVVGAVVLMGTVGYNVASAVDGRYLLRTVGEQFQVTNCMKFALQRQETVEDAVAKLEIQRDEAARDRRVTWTPADNQTLQRWYRQRRSPQEIKRDCEDETKGAKP